jgi:hypothetical protein
LILLLNKTQKVYKKELKNLINRARKFILGVALLVMPTPQNCCKTKEMVRGRVTGG